MSFDKYSVLDPAKMLRDINEAADPDVPFDQFSLLDPERARRQVETALGIQIDPATMLDPARFQQVIEHAIEDASEGDGDSSEIVIDFQRGVYTVDGSPVAISSLMFGDEENWAPFSVDEVHPQAGLSIAVPSLTGEALSRILAGATIIFDITLRNGNFSLDAYVPPDFDIDYGCTFFSSANGTLAEDFGGDLSVAGEVTLRPGRMHLAMTFTEGKITAANAKEFVTTSVTGLATNISFDIGDNTLHSVRIIPPVADEDICARCIPQNAKGHIDLVQQFAWTEANGFVAINTLLGSDPNTENGWGGTSYDAGNLTSAGYVSSGNPPAFIGDLLSAVLVGFTGVIRFSDPDNTGNSPSFVLLSADGNDALEIDFNGNDGVLQAYSWAGDIHPYGSENGPIVNGGVSACMNQMAVTVTGSRFEIAMNGGSVGSDTLGEDDRPSGNPLVAALFDPNTKAFQFFTWYDTFPSTDGLSELSQTGVVNTAPAAIHVYGNEGNPDEFSLTVSHDEVVSSVPWNLNSGAPAGVTPPLPSLFYTSDAEGNPFTFSLSDDDGGNWSIAFDGTYWQLTLNNVLSVGDHHYTLRATDPGGLYVEQEFTITVTA